MNKSWVVYKMTIPGQPVRKSAVCEQREWDEMERTRPGYHQLVWAGIPNESEAEKLARADSGNAQPSGYPKILV